MEDSKGVPSQGVPLTSHAAEQPINIKIWENEATRRISAAGLSTQSANKVPLVTANIPSSTPRRISGATTVDLAMAVARNDGNEAGDPAFMDDLLRHLDMFAAYNQSRVDAFLSTTPMNELGLAVKLILENRPSDAQEAEAKRRNSDLLRRGSAPRLHTNAARRNSNRRTSSGCAERVQRRSSIVRRPSVAMPNSAALRRGSNTEISAEAADVMADQIALMYDEADSFLPASAKSMPGSKGERKSSFSSVMGGRKTSFVRRKSVARGTSPKAASRRYSANSPANANTSSDAPGDAPKHVPTGGALKKVKTRVAFSSVHQSTQNDHASSIKAAEHSVLRFQSNRKAEIAKKHSKTNTSKLIGSLARSVTRRIAPSKTGAIGPANDDGTTKTEATIVAHVSRVKGAVSPVAKSDPKSDNKKMVAPIALIGDNSNSGKSITAQPIAPLSIITKQGTPKKTDSHDRSPSPVLFADRPAPLPNRKQSVVVHAPGKSKRTVVPITFEEDDEDEVAVLRSGKPISSRIWIHPESSILSIWRMLLPPVALWLSVYVPALLVFDENSSDRRHMTNCLFEIILMLDVVIQFEFLAFRDELTMTIVTEHARIRLRYLGRWPVLHVVGSLPFELLGPSLGAFHGLRVCKVLHVLRLGFYPHHYDQMSILNYKQQSFFSLTPTQKRMTKIICAFCFIIHLFVCGYWMIVRHEVNYKTFSANRFY
jgi:hypothetical protein